MEEFEHLTQNHQVIVDHKLYRFMSWPCTSDIEFNKVSSPADRRSVRPTFLYFLCFTNYYFQVSVQQQNTSSSAADSARSSLFFPMVIEFEC